MFAHSHLLRELGGPLDRAGPDGGGKLALATAAVSSSASSASGAYCARGTLSESTFDALVGDLDYPMFIVTVCADGEPSGCLVGFATQASIDPSRFLVCLSHVNHTCRVGRDAELLGVHFVPEEHAELAELFGGETGDEVDKFARCEWRPAPAARRCSTPARTASSAACSSASTPATTTRSCSSRWSPSAAGADEFTFHRAKRIEPGTRPDRGAQRVGRVACSRVPPPGGLSML